MTKQKKQMSTPSGVLTGILIAVFIVNQFMIGYVAEALGKKSGMGMVMAVSFGTNSDGVQMIMMPVLDEGGGTTSLMEMPTITEVPGYPDSGDAVADAMVVMLGHGTTFYAPDGLNFDDAVEALSGWGRYDSSVELSAADQARYDRLIMVFPCSFCCGGATSVAVVGRCGCAHARAARGFFKYMLSSYGDTYTDEQLVGEGYRWQAIWYPSGVVEDYLLATGRSDVIGHQSHGGAGADGMHGLTGN